MVINQWLMVTNWLILENCFFSAKNLVHGFVDIQAPKNVERRFTTIVYLVFLAKCTSLRGCYRLFSIFIEYEPGIL